MQGQLGAANKELEAKCAELARQVRNCNGYGTVYMHQGALSAVNTAMPCLQSCLVVLVLGEGTIFNYFVLGCFAQVDAVSREAREARGGAADAQKLARIEGEKVRPWPAPEHHSYCS